MIGDIIGVARLAAEPRYTTNHFDTLAAVAGKSLDVLERNEWGDCFCLVREGAGYLIDVDARDVAEFSAHSNSIKDFLAAARARTA